MYPLENRQWLSICRKINFDRESVKASFAFRSVQSPKTALLKQCKVGWVASHTLTRYFPAVDWLRNLIDITENVPAHHLLEPCFFFKFSGWAVSVAYNISVPLFHPSSELLQRLGLLLLLLLPRLLLRLLPGDGGVVGRALRALAPLPPDLLKRKERLLYINHSRCTSPHCDFPPLFPSSIIKLLANFFASGGDRKKAPRGSED